MSQRTYEINFDEQYKGVENIDEWGCACLYEDDEIKLEYNYCFENGESNCAIYRMIDEGDRDYVLDGNTFRHYDIEWDKPDWKERLIREMNDYLDELESCERNKNSNELITAIRNFSNAAISLLYMIEKHNAEEYCTEAYPFDKSFDEIVGKIIEWKDVFIDCVKNGIKHSYFSAVYASEVVPQWKDDSNLFYVEFDGKVLYEWFLKNKAIKGDAEDFNRFMQEEATADMMVGAYDYCDSRSGVISVVKGLEVII